MTCYLRLHEVTVAVLREVAAADWDEVERRWREAAGVGGRDAALAAMPVTVIDLDDLPGADLDPFAGLILSGRADQRLLATMGERLGAFLDRGGAVVFRGQLSGDWLPGATPFQRTAPDDGAEDPRPPRLICDALFAGVAVADLGPSFLYRHGWHRPPHGAEVVARRGDGTPGAYVDRTSGGTILLHGGANLLATGTAVTSAARILPQLVTWVAAQARR